MSEVHLEYSASGAPNPAQRLGGQHGFALPIAMADGQ